MRKNKFYLLSPIACSVAIAPVFLTTSCSVYKNMLKGFTPNYQKLSVSSINKEQAINHWFEKSKSVKDFIKQESQWSNSTIAKWTKKADVPSVPGLRYEGKFTKFNVNYSYASVSNFDEHRISIKFNYQIDKENSYYYNNEFAGTGVDHYIFELEIIDLQYDAVVFGALGEKHWMLKPVKYVFTPEAYYWNEALTDSEQIKFNIKWIMEVYDKKGLQSYGYECTEAAVLDKDRCYFPDLAEAIDNAVCFYSYYLEDSPKTE